MKKTKRKKSKTTKAIRSAKSADRGRTQARRKEGSPRDWPGVNASVKHVLQQLKQARKQ